tara:strand:- start:198 stop:377 length:180 start_codon:yes stop_codon:yes gene_type:complete
MLEHHHRGETEPELAAELTWFKVRVRVRAKVRVRARVRVGARARAWVRGSRACPRERWP